MPNAIMHHLDVMPAPTHPTMTCTSPPLRILSQQPSRAAGLHRSSALCSPPGHMDGPSPSSLVASTNTHTYVVRAHADQFTLTTLGVLPIFITGINE